MGTSPGNSLTNLDFDLSCPTNTSLSDYGYQTQNMDSSGFSYRDQNMENIEKSNKAKHNEQDIKNKLSPSGKLVKKPDLEALKRHVRKLCTNYDSLLNNYETINKDYDTLKKQYAKLGSDYANLHEENKKNAMACLNFSTICDNLEKKEVEYLATIDALKQQCEKYSWDILAQKKQSLQYDSHIKNLVGQINKLKNDAIIEKNKLEENRKIISNLTSDKQTLTEHLCLLGCVIDGRKKLNKDSQRLIQAFCKKITSSKKNLRK